MPKPEGKRNRSFEVLKYLSKRVFWSENRANQLANSPMTVELRIRGRKTAEPILQESSKSWWRGCKRESSAETAACKKALMAAIVAGDAGEYM
jgi:hypothetical protein